MAKGLGRHRRIGKPDCVKEPSRVLQRRGRLQTCGVRLGHADVRRGRRRAHGGRWLRLARTMQGDFCPLRLTKLEGSMMLDMPRRPELLTNQERVEEIRTTANPTLTEDHIEFLRRYGSPRNTEAGQALFRSNRELSGLPRRIFRLRARQPRPCSGRRVGCPYCGAPGGGAGVFHAGRESLARTLAGPKPTGDEPA